MKKEVITTYILEEHDLEDILKGLPACPCDSCGMGAACCGCPDGNKYYDVINNYKKRGIYEYAQLINDFHKKERVIEEYTKDIENIRDTFWKELGIHIT